MPFLSLQVAWDMNGDGLFTSADVWLLEKWLLCLPGNFLLELFAFWLPRTAAFFHVHASGTSSYASFYGIAAWVISAVIWVRSATRPIFPIGCAALIDRLK